MEPERNTQVPGRIKRKETGSTSVTERQPPNQRKAVQHNGELPPDLEWHFTHQYEDFCCHQPPNFLNMACNKDLEEDPALIRSNPNVSSSIYEYPGNTRPVPLAKIIYHSMNKFPVKHNKRCKRKRYVIAIIVWKRGKSVLPLAVNPSCTSDYTFSQCKFTFVRKRTYTFLCKYGPIVETVNRKSVSVRSILNRSCHSWITGQFHLNFYHSKYFTKDIKIEIYDHLVKSHSTMRPVVKVPADRILSSIPNPNKQFAFATIYFKSGKSMHFPVVYPCRNSDSTFLHSEEIVIQEIDSFLSKCGSDVRTILIYSTNSPCLKRCMPKLQNIAYEWDIKYKIKTVLIFRNYWGEEGPNHSPFQGLTYSDISESQNKKYVNVDFDLDTKAFLKLRPNDILLSSGVVIADIEKKQRGPTYKFINLSMAKLAENPDSCTKSEYLENIPSLEPLTNVDSEIAAKILRALKEKWIDMVEQSFTSLIIEKMTAEYNTALVGQFALSLDRNGPFHLCHLQEDGNILNILTNSFFIF